MTQYDSVVLFNAPVIQERAGSREKLYPANFVREDVWAIAECLENVGHAPCVIMLDRFSEDIITTLLKISPDFVFNLCEEIDGQCECEMHVAGLLELMGIPYTGSDSFVLGLSLNKFHVKRILSAAGIPTARAFLCYPGQQPSAPANMHFPMFVKPAREDASLGINSDSVCRNEAELAFQVDYIHRVYKQEALIESYLDGREFNVSVAGNSPPEVLSISEIDFTGLPEEEPRIVSYRAKWDEASAQFRCTRPVCPAELPDSLERQIKAVALQSFRAIGCRDYGRIDMRTDSCGNLYVLEVNPNPDISPSAGFARAAKVAGYSYQEIILRITESAMDRVAKMGTQVYAF
ncbi:MAG TPA: D-alanine--D-alanine ligase [Acidobacteriota bacterium]|nr:D-alanine--D-alanine ligase [Acidobacteriota bacterium]